MIVDRAKKVARKAFVSQISRYIANASPKTLARMWGLFEKMASKEEDAREARRFRWLVQEGHPFGRWLERISEELSPAARTALIRNLYGYAWFLNRGTRQQFRERHGFSPPYIMVIDVTARCNLSCEGCWAAHYRKGGDLDFDVLDQVITEAEEEMGMHFVVFSGGEPTLREDLYDIYENHPNTQFQIYTNGTLIDNEMAARFAELGNVMPMVSIEGDDVLTNNRRGDGVHGKILDAMDYLRDHGVLFGFSATATKHNVDSISSDEFIETMVERGCLYGWYFQYIPIGRNPDPDMMVTPEQRDRLRRRVYHLRNTYPIFLADFWNDGPEVNGCMAGGKRYFHINNDGGIEPCVFCHFAVDNVYETSITEALKHPLFEEMRNAIPYDGNLLRPCMLIDRPQVFRRLAEKHGAEPTHPGAETLITSLADDMDEQARGWEELATQAWENDDYMGLYPYPSDEHEQDDGSSWYDRVVAEKV
ncbi:MAG: radical SAM protein [Candidatus Brocadiia bacterium]